VASPPIEKSSSTVSEQLLPRSLQTDDGKIYIFSHQGSDDPYGKTDQAIIMDTFPLAKK